MRARARRGARSQRAMATQLIVCALALGSVHGVPDRCDISCGLQLIALACGLPAFARQALPPRCTGSALQRAAERELPHVRMLARAYAQRCDKRLYELSQTFVCVTPALSEQPSASALCRTRRRSRSARSRARAREHRRHTTINFEMLAACHCLCRQGEVHRALVRVVSMPKPGARCHCAHALSA